ncbi:hypothetical protein JXA40_10890 [bacterium]|nr:hypothetical protein [candidate division CSSED10-310 bacterium]
MIHGRPLKPLLYGISLIILLLFTTSWIMTFTPEKPSYLDIVLSKSHRVLAYEINRLRPAVFKIPPQAECLEIITNLDIYRSLDLTCMVQYEYGLEVEIRDSAGEIQRKEIYWENTRRSQWMDSQDDIPMAAAFYINKPQIPADSRMTTIRLNPGRNDDVYVSVRLVSPAQATASVRIYRHVDMTEGNELGNVRQISRNLKSKMALHNLYGNRIRDFEVQRFLRDVLRQIPAEGRSGIDYITRDLFLYDREIPILGEPPPEDSLICGQHPMYFPLRGPVNLKLTFREGDTVRITVHHEDGTERVEEFRIRPGYIYRKDFDRGLYLVELKTLGIDAAIQSVEVDPPDNRLDIPQRSSTVGLPYRMTNYYRIQPAERGDPVLVRIPRNDGHGNQPLKIVCRVPMDDPGPDTSTPFTLFYSFKNADGETITENRYQSDAISTPFALYMQDGTILPQRPSYPDRLFLHPPEHTHSIQFHSSIDVDVSFFCRLTDPEIHVVYTGDDSEDHSGAFRFIEKETNPSEWHYFRPHNAEQLVQDSRRYSVMLPGGILERRMEQGETQPGAVARTCFPVDPAGTGRVMEAVRSEISTGTSCYREIEPGTDGEFEIGGPAMGGMNLEIRYFLFRPENPMIRVQVDGETGLNFRPLTVNGTFTLPLVTRGIHRIQIDSSSRDDRFYLKMVPGLKMNGSDQAYRTVFRLDGKENLFVPIVKPEWSACGMNIMVYAEEGIALPLSIDIKAENLRRIPDGRSSKHLTSSCRRYVITEPDGFSPVFLTGEMQLDRITSLYFPLHDDIPPGEYALTVSSDSNRPVFVRFFMLQRESG